MMIPLDDLIASAKPTRLAQPRQSPFIQINDEDFMLVNCL
jgi:hypothetical protein